MNNFKLIFSATKRLALHGRFYSPVIIRFLSVFVGFFLSVIIARVLGKEVFGVFIFLITVSLFISILSSFGLGRIALRIFASEQSLKSLNFRKLLFKQFFIIWVLISTVVFTVALIFYFIFFEYLSFDVGQVIAVASISYGILMGWRVIAVDIFIANKRPLDAVIIDGFVSNLIMIFSLLIVKEIYTKPLVLLDIISLHIFSVFLVQLCGILRLRKVLQYSKKESDCKSVIRPSKMVLILDARFAFYHRLGMSLSSFADVWLLGVFSAVSFVADYGISFKIATFISFLLASLNGIIPPYFSDYIQKGDKIQLERFCRFFATIVAIPSVILAITLFLYGGNIISLMFGSSFESAGEVLRVLVIMHIANVLSGPCGSMLVIYGLNKELMKIMLISASATIILAFIIAINFGGGMTIVWCFVIGAVVRQFLLWLLVMDKCGVNTAPTLNFSVLRSEASRLF